MFVRARLTSKKFQFSLVQTRRIGGKVAHEHIAGLGSVAIEPSIHERLEFWRSIRERLVGLNSETGTKITRAVHAKVPIVSAEERRRLIENARADTRRAPEAQPLAKALAKAQPKRRSARFEGYLVRTIDPKDPNYDPDGVTNHDRVRAALAGFSELAQLSAALRDALIEDLVCAICHARYSVKVGKRGVSNKATSQQVFLSDVARALERAGVRAKRWRKKYDNDGGESFFFKLAREVARVSDIKLPKDLKLLAARAAQIKYGAMSPAMAAAQTAELATSNPEPVES